MVFTPAPHDPPTFGNITFWTADYGEYTYTVAEDAGQFSASARRKVAGATDTALLLGNYVLSYDEAVHLCRIHAAHATGALP